MRHYWKANGTLVLCTDDDDETDDMVDWFTEYQRGDGSLLEVDTEDRPMRGRPMNSPYGGGRRQSMGRLSRRRDGDGTWRRDGDGTRRRDGDGTRRGSGED